METQLAIVTRSTVAKGLLLAAIALSLALAAALPARASFEPNDSIPAAAGPLLGGQSLQARMESPTDADFYFFYVTGSAPTSVSVANLGGSGEPGSEISAQVVDALGMYAGGDFAYVRKGEARTSSIALRPGKYFFQVFALNGQGDTYEVRPGTNGGAFKSYAEITGRCAAAESTVLVRRRQLDRAKAKLERAINRVQRSRYGSRKARQAAQRLHAEAKARVATRKRALKAATKSRSPWCSIPQ